MNPALRRISKPHCYLVYALAPPEMSAAEANRIFNIFIGDRRLPLAVFHDHFIDQPGGLALFYVETPEQRDALLDQQTLAGWQVNAHPLVFADSPSGFDDQIAWTLRTYRGVSWDRLRTGG